MTEQPKVRLPPLDQIGIVVKDLDKAIQYYTETFGWGPFQVIEVQMEGFIYEGKSGSCRQKLALAKSGSVEIELIQIIEGETPHSKFLRESGEGLQHLRFLVDDLDGTLAELATKGISPIFHKRFPEAGVSIVYVNSDKVGGVMFELMEHKSLPITK